MRTDEGGRGATTKRQRGRAVMSGPAKKRWRRAIPQIGALATVLILAGTLLLGGIAGAQELPGGSLTGRVTAGETGLPGVTVTAHGPVTAQAVTTLDGTYRVLGLPAGNYTLTLSRDGLQGDPPFRSVVLSGAVVQGLDFLAMPTAPLLPTIRLAPSATQIRPGDTFTLRLSLTPGTQEPKADLYLSLVPPGAPLRAETPWQANLLVPAVTEAPVFSYTVTGEEPPGAYTWLAFLTRPGTMDLLGPVGVAMVTVQP